MAILGFVERVGRHLARDLSQALAGIVSIVTTSLFLAVRGTAIPVPMPIPVRARRS